MHRRLPMFYSALLLTLVNLLLRLVGTSFQVYLSRQIGPAGVGLLQLVMSVVSLSIVAGVAGIRTAAMYLTADALGRRPKSSVGGVLSGCLGYSACFSTAAAAGLYLLSPRIAAQWIGTPEASAALGLFAAFLPVICLCNVMIGYFTAANRIGTLSAVEVAEQLLSMAVTMTALQVSGRGDPVRACQCVILGSGCAACMTLSALVLLRILEHAPCEPPQPMLSRLANTALPLALADVTKSGINTAENLMVPRRLACNRGIADPLAAFGMVSGMVFPVMMFPACILFGLAELLIPEMARCDAAGSRERIDYLTGKSLHIAMLYGLLFGGLEFLLAKPLCLGLYGSTDAGRYLRLYTLLIPMLYCDAITDAMTKGLGQQRICVRYNILTSAMDVCFLWLLLPRYGMVGYFASFAVTHLVNFILSLRLLLKTTRYRIPAYHPLLAGSAALAAVAIADLCPAPVWKAAAYCAIFGSLLCLLGVTGQADFLWLKGVICAKKQPSRRKTERAAS